MTSTTTLSRNDLAILGAIFDPETSLSANAHTRQPTGARLSPTETNTSVSPADSHIIAAEKTAIQYLNTPDPTINQITSAILQLSTLIEQTPTYASAYTNRAQATRLLPDSLQSPDHVTSILSDLNSAIMLLQATNPDTQNDRQIATTYAHRAYLLLHAATNTAFFSLLQSLPQNLGLPTGHDLTQSHVEELASQDFAIAGRHGDDKARQMAVKTNPYAKLCGAIVKEALREEIRGFYEGEGGVF